MEDSGSPLSSKPTATQLVGLSAEPESPYGVALGASVHQLATELAGAALPSAPVQLPSQDDLTVRLVNISMLQRLDELRGDVTLLQTIFYTIIGALLGSVTNFFGSGQAVAQIDKITFAVSAILIFFLGLFGFLWRRAARRADRLRAKLFGSGV